MTQLRDIKKDYPEAEYWYGWAFVSPNEDLIIVDEDGSNVNIDQFIEDHYRQEYWESLGKDSTATIKEFINHVYGSYELAFKEV